MDTRDTPEQAELRRAARQLARNLGPATVADLEDTTRAERLAATVRDAGWLDLRDGAGDGGADGAPLAGGEEAAIVAEALGAAVADVAFSGPILAADLARRTGTAHADGVADGAVVAFSETLVDAALVSGGVTTAVSYAVDAATGAGATGEGAIGVGGAHDGTAYVLVDDDDGYRLATVSFDGRPDGADLTRVVRPIPAGVDVRPIVGGRQLTPADLAGWNALGLALTSADLVGVMRGVLDVTVAYASERRQYGVPIGSFQAVQHLLAEARALLEGSVSVALHASWAVDNLAPEEACAAGRVAKIYCARAARTVCETAIQVHGGIGNTWECIVHVYLRRALLSSTWFGDDGVQLHRLERARLGAGVGLS